MRSIRSLGGAQGVASLIENECRVRGRLVPLHAVTFGPYRIESCPECGANKFEVLRHHVEIGIFANLAQAILKIALIDPTIDLLHYHIEMTR